MLSTLVLATTLGTATALRAVGSALPASQQWKCASSQSHHNTHRVASLRVPFSPRLMATLDINWAAPIDTSAPDSEPTDGSTVVPLFPLGVTYLPYTKHVLNIFEPRYRKMYNDILMNGARRFMVCNIDGETGRFAEVGVLFYLDDLKEVSEQTGDRVKYVGSHSVTTRVRLKKVLNPQVTTTRETYLRAEVEELTDTDAGEASEAEEATMRQQFEELVDMQGKLGEEPRFTEAVKESLSFERGSGTDDTGLWGTILLWQQFLEQRTSVLGQKMQREMQKTVVAFLKDNEIDEGLVNSRGEMRLEDLPEPLAGEIRGIQRRYREELEDMSSDPYGLQFQALLQAPSHKERLLVLEEIIGKERKRLAARATLQSMFKKDEE